MKAEPLLAAIAQGAGTGHRARILLSPAGAPLTQARVRELAKRCRTSCSCAAATRASTSA